MAKYLDSTGLTHLWGKVKAYVTGYVSASTSDNVTTVTIGNTSITPALKSEVVTDVGYNTTEKKLTKTINGTASDVVTASKIVEDGGGIKSHQSVTDNSPTLAWGTTSKVATIGSTDIHVTMPSNPDTDTKNTAGSTSFDGQMYLIGAKTQAANPQTYSNANVWMRNGALFANTPSSGTNNQQVATTEFVNAAIQSSQTGAAMFKGVVNTGASISGLTAYSVGWYWVVGTAGTYCGEACEAGDMIFCTSDYSSAYSASDFSIVQNNLETMTSADIDAAILAAG